jgi:hypothetical protein
LPEALQQVLLQRHKKAATAEELVFPTSKGTRTGAGDGRKTLD